MPYGRVGGVDAGSVATSQPRSAPEADAGKSPATKTAKTHGRESVLLMPAIAKLSRNGRATGTGRLLKHAQQVAKLGWPVFPCWGVEAGRCQCGDDDCEHAGKHPCGRYAPRGFKSATTSLHASGRRYKFRKRHTPYDVEPAKCPDWLLALATTSTGKQRPATASANRWASRDLWHRAQAYLTQAGNGVSTRGARSGHRRSVGTKPTHLLSDDLDNQRSKQGNTRPKQTSKAGESVYMKRCSKPRTPLFL